MPEPAPPWGAQGVTVAAGARTVLDDVTLLVRPGQVVAVVGGDGAGKSTLLRTVIGRVVPASGRVVRPARSRVGYQPASAGSWARLTVDENLDLVARAYALPADVAAPRRQALLDAAGLATARTRPAGQLSGGMRQKLGFCMAMLHQPTLLVLDEPSTGVDPVSRVELWALIADAAARGTAVVLATTYLDEAERVQHLVVLDGGTVLLAGTPSQVLRTGTGTITRVAAPVDAGTAWRRGRHTRQWHPGPPRPGEDVVTPDLEDALVAAALERGGGSPPAPPHPAHRGSPAPADRDARAAGPLVRATELTRRFGANRAVDGVSIEVGPGEIVGLIGANGAGKTTLIRLLLGVVAPSSGSVSLFGAPPSRRTRRRVGYVPQGLGLYRDLTVGENLSFVAAAYGGTAALQGTLRDVGSDLVETVGLGHRRSLAFACALAHSPALLVLDEPTSGVDPLTRARLWDTVHAQADSGVGLLVSTHHMQEAEQCDRLVLMDLGRVVAQGSSAEVIGATTAVSVAGEDWSAAFSALRAAGLPVALAGRAVRVVGVQPAAVAAALRAAGVSALVDVRPATLEEAMTAITLARPRR